MDIFDNVHSLLEEKEIKNEIKYTFLKKNVIYMSLNKLDRVLLSIDLVLNISDKYSIINDLIHRLGSPIQSTENTWHEEKVQNSNFSESKIEKKAFTNIKNTDIEEIMNSDVIRWNYESIIITVSNYPLVRGIAGDNFYINIR
jgi:hypothetical protein